MKTTTAKDVALAYPDYSKEFEIYTYALSKQLGTVIAQGNRRIAFFSRKLTETQLRYSVTEIELLAIVEILKEFNGMLCGQRTMVYTDHINLIQDAGLIEPGRCKDPDSKVDLTYLPHDVPECTGHLQMFLQQTFIPRTLS